MPPKKLLILDIDETLLCASEQPLEREADFRVGQYHIYTRPGLPVFLDHCFQWFDVAIWTSSSPLYAEEVVTAIVPDPTRLTFVWASERGTMAYDLETGERYATKNLKKLKRLGYSLEAVIAVDDSPEKWKQSYGNLVQVAPYHGAAEDTELIRLAFYLDFLKDQPNIRSIEKRHWRQSTPPPAAPRLPWPPPQS